jgi:hypothetical protein
MSRFNVSAKRGDTIRLLITCTRAGSPVNLTGASIWATFKRSISDTDAAATTIQKTLDNGIVVTDAANGLAVVTLDPADTASLTKETTFEGDIQVREADGIVTTVADGSLFIALDVTRVA